MASATMSRSKPWKAEYPDRPFMTAPDPVPSAGQLLADFPSVTYDDWRKVVEAELKGAPFDKKMFTATYEGIHAAARFIGGKTSPASAAGELFPWVCPVSARGQRQRLCQASRGRSRRKSPSPARRNSITPRAIDRPRAERAQHGAGQGHARTATTRTGREPEEVGGGGLSIATLAIWTGRSTGWTSKKRHCSSDPAPRPCLSRALLVALARKRKKTPAALRGCIEMDPLGVLAHEGRLPQSLGGRLPRNGRAHPLGGRSRAPACKRSASTAAPGTNPAATRCRNWPSPWPPASNISAQMNERGLEVDVAAPRMRFAVTVGANFFMEIAKLRALRMLWSRAVSRPGGDEAAQKISLHVRTAQWNKTVVRSLQQSAARDRGGVRRRAGRLRQHAGRRV